MTTKHSFKEGNQIIIHTEGEICSTVSDLTRSESFKGVVRLFLGHLRKQESPLLHQLGLALREVVRDDSDNRLIALLSDLAFHGLEELAQSDPYAASLLETDARAAFHRFVEDLYDYWRSFDRFMVLHSQPGPSGYERRPYRAFNATIETLTHTVRSFYRDVCENITGNHPRIYRQVAAGCNVGLIAVPGECPLPEEYAGALRDVPFIRHVWIAPSHH